MVFSLAALLMTTDFSQRAEDWRNGAVVYQVFVDRFAPSQDLDRKRNLYPAPRQLKKWKDLPKPGKFLPNEGYWTHEVDFWGGDIASTEGKLAYVKNLGADVLYLTPIFKAMTNHKYDTSDYLQIDPQFGTASDFESLISATHRGGMKLMLDGVFNHIGRTAPLFQDAFKNPNDPHRDWFFFGKQYSLGYRGWVGIGNLPVWKLENKGARNYLWGGKDSVVRKYLRDGIDGWRLDVAFELGQKNLSELTAAAHETKPGSAVIGEISGYPAEWCPAVDGTFNFTALNIAQKLCTGEVTGARAGLIFDQMVQDGGIENLLKCWLLTDNHDTDRLASKVPDFAVRRLLVGLQFTLPGCPVVYYGTELGMTGVGDPPCRAPMRWDLATQSNQDLAWYRRLIAIRKKLPSLRYGDYHSLATDKLLAFIRTTDAVRDGVMVVVNPGRQAIRESFPTRMGRVMSWGELEDVVSGRMISSTEGVVTVEAPPMSISIYQVRTPAIEGHTQYDRIH